jgi:3-oxoacyl-[acyl-carrier protein] reductase
MTDYALQDKTAIVTGASRGIGRAVALALAAEGARLLLAARASDALSAIAAECEALGARSLIAPTDISDENAVRTLAAQARAQWEHVDLLVNCAGIGVFKPLLETSSADWDRVMAVNARGSFLMCREVAPLMPAGGCIVNVASVVGVKGYVNQGAYSASKHALMGLTKVLAQELQPNGIRVHVVCPGGVATDLVKQARPDLDTSDLMTAEEVAEVILFLARQRGRGIVDQINLRRASSAPWFS